MLARRSGHAAVARQRCVWLTQLPPTALPADLQRLGLAGGERTPGKSHVAFLRTPLLEPTGTALVLLPSDADAQQYAQHASGSVLGGEEVHARELSVAEGVRRLYSHHAHLPRDMRLPMDLIAADAMQVVLLRGMPLLTTAEKLEKKLRRSYALAGAADTRIAFTPAPVTALRVAEAERRQSTALGAPLTNAPAVLKLPHHRDATAASFLVRMHSVSEAMRIVRSWHRSHYNPSKYGVERTGDRYVVDAHVMY